MPDDRFIHRRIGHSDKISALADFEFRVWVQYLLSSDDFGVMRFTAATLQADCDALAGKNTKAVQRALERLAVVGLIRTYQHQSRTYCYQHDWQDFQKVDYPRATLHPKPPTDGMTAATAKLFAKFPGGWGRKVPPASDDGSANVPRTDPEPLGERSGEITPEPLAVSRKPVAVSRERDTLADESAERAGQFVSWYADTHLSLFGVGYIGNPQTDYQRALQLVAAFSDSDLRDAALVWFGQDDDFAKRGTRTIPKFASRASDCVATARRVAS